MSAPPPAPPPPPPLPPIGGPGAKKVSRAKSIKVKVRKPQSIPPPPPTPIGTPFLSVPETGPSESPSDVPVPAFHVGGSPEPPAAAAVLTQGVSVPPPPPPVSQAAGKKNKPHPLAINIKQPSEELPPSPEKYDPSTPALFPPPPSPPVDYSTTPVPDYEDDDVAGPGTSPPEETTSVRRSAATRHSVNLLELDIKLEYQPKFPLPSGPVPPPPMVGSQPDSSVSVNAALGQVNRLLQLPCDADNNPTIEAAAIGLEYEANKDRHFEDRAAFMSGNERYMEDVVRQAKVDDVLEEGAKHASMLYSWRCCSYAIGRVQSKDHATNIEICQQTVNILEPEIEKLRRFYKFQGLAVVMFCDEVKRLCARESFVPTAYLLSLGKLIKMFAVLDELKNIKASIKNDFSTYKRAGNQLKRQISQEAVLEQEQLQMFLAGHGAILLAVRESIQKLPGYDELLCSVISACVSMYEQHTYLLPAEKHGCIEVIGFSLYLIDSEAANINKLDSRKKINIHKIDKMFKQLEIVPLFGDMMINPFHYITRTPNYDPEKWPRSASGTERSSQAELIKSMPALRTEHTKLLAELVEAGSNRDTLGGINTEKPGKEQAGQQKPMPPRDHSATSSLALKALHKLSGWTARITELVSWKLVNPTSHEYNRSCPEEAEEYERATRYNYSNEEKLCMVELISMIKAVQEVIMGMVSMFQQSIHADIYHHLQDFVQIQLREPMRKSIKHKKNIIRSIVGGIMALCSDTAEGMQAEADPLHKGKKDADSGFQVVLNQRSCPPSSTQLYMLRCMLESLVDKSQGKKASLRKDIDGQHISIIEAFLKNTQYWQHLIHFEQSLTACCDLSQFWYREFYLEMSKGHRIQFPIEMSLPWILTDHILESQDAKMIEYVLYPMDLYNDSATYALCHFSKQYMYTEIESEVNLCFDQLVFKLSEDIYAHYKKLAASLYLDTQFRSACRRLGVRVAQVERRRFESVFRQTHVQLLGRTVDLRALIAARVNASLQRSIDVALKTFEAGDLTGIMEMDGMLEMTRLTHRLLSRHLPLDPFDALFKEANNNVDIPYSRITMHVFYEIYGELLPHYCYNATTERFVLTKLKFADSIERDKAPKAGTQHTWGSKELVNCFSSIYSQYQGFVGKVHFSTITKWLGYQDIAIIFRELLTIIKNMLNDAVIPMLITLKNVYPKRCILPRYDYTSPGVFQYYQAQLMDITNYTDLQPIVFQALREFGNSLIVCFLLEQGLNHNEVIELTLSGMFQGILPRPFLPKKEGQTKEERQEAEAKMVRKLHARYHHCKATTIIGKLGSDTQKSIINDSSLLTRERLCCGLSIFQHVLQHIGKLINADDELWAGTHTTSTTDTGEPNILETNDNREFHRLWSALQFVVCLPPASLTVEELFGEGLQWAGCTLITLLGQQRRFEVLDFCYHILNVHKVDQKTDVVKGVDIKKLTGRITKFKILNDEIFSILNKCLQGPQDKEQLAYKVLLKEMEPPRRSGAHVTLRQPSDDNNNSGNTLSEA